MPTTHDPTGGDMAHTDTCHMSVGTDCRLTAEPRPDGQVELRGIAAGNYPVLGLRMPRGAALRLAAAILDALGGGEPLPPDAARRVMAALPGDDYPRDDTPTGDLPPHAGGWSLTGRAVATDG